jgi:hypothetical protein
MKTEKWVAVRAGGELQTICVCGVWVVPVCSSHDDAIKLWHGKSEDRQSWAIRCISDSSDCGPAKEVL